MIESVNILAFAILTIYCKVTWEAIVWLNHNQCRLRKPITYAMEHIGMLPCYAITYLL